MIADQTFLPIPLLAPFPLLMASMTPIAFSSCGGRNRLKLCVINGMVTGSKPTVTSATVLHRDSQSHYFLVCYIMAK